MQFCQNCLPSPVIRNAIQRRLECICRQAVLSVLDPHTTPLHHNLHTLGYFVLKDKVIMDAIHFITATHTALFINYIQPHSESVFQQPSTATSNTINVGDSKRMIYDMLSHQPTDTSNVARFSMLAPI